MARIAGNDLPKNKRGEIGLTYIYGVGRSRAREILEKAEIDVNIKVGDWTDEQVASIRKILENEYKVEGALRSEVNSSIRRLIEIGSYRGLRHRRGLPARGQRTKTNARTRKGRRKSVMGKKKAPRK
ncbi:MAG TPA: 30S ribosomal protein S13 [Bacteroidales bacterium]|nr:30S ribosomal protein S13 [Bacteroidales bacterium]